MPAYGITVAPTGARRQTFDHPNLPLTADDIASTAHACFLAGAHRLHLHVREADGSHSLDASRYRVAIVAVSDAAPSMLIQITTESAGRYSVADQLACLKGSLR